MSEKPQVSTTSEKLTDTIVNSTNQAVKNVAPTAAVSSVNAYGIRTMRGGTILGSGFLESVVNAYTNLLSYNPLALVMFIIATYYYIGLIVGVAAADPFKLMATGVVTKHESMKAGAGKSILATFAGIFAWIDTYKPFFALMFGFSGVYLAKPSTRNAILSAILLAACFLFKFDAVMILGIIQLFFLYTQVRDPKHKTIILIIAVIVIFIGSANMGELVDLKTLKTTYGTPAASSG
ncbi:MAG: hypothetical protein 3 [Zeugodacus tau negev-like virus]|nr:MAG: hypothetical protein 3 [Zeugodacus tau negev-like virus]